jgi:hypothetical protein
MSLAMAYSTKKRQGNGAKMCAEGGEIGNADMHDADMIARIMHKRKEYAKGGVVANDVGVSEADKLPAEFDDLELDDHLEDTEHASDEIGDDRVHDDAIDRVMMKRKKDRMPRPT